MSVALKTLLLIGLLVITGCREDFDGCAKCRNPFNWDDWDAIHFTPYEWSREGYCPLISGGAVPAEQLRKLGIDEKTVKLMTERQPISEVHALHEGCWKKLTPKERVPYYARRFGKSENWSLIKSNVLAGL